MEIRLQQIDYEAAWMATHLAAPEEPRQDRMEAAQEEPAVALRGQLSTQTVAAPSHQLEDPLEPEAPLYLFQADLPAMPPVAA